MRIDKNAFISHVTLLNDNRLLGFTNFMHQPSSVKDARIMRNMGHSLEVFFCSMHRYWLVRRQSFMLFVCALAFVGANLLFFSHIYYANDNFAIMVTFREGDIVRYVPALSAKLTHALYAHLSMDIPWFGLLLYAAHVAAVFMLFNILSWSADALIKLPILCLFCVYYANFLIRVGYNGASICLGALAIASFVVHLHTHAKVKWGSIVFFGVALAGAFLLRKQGLRAAFAVGSPLLVLAIVGHGKRQYWAFLVFLTPVALTGFANILLERHATTGIYAEYVQFDQLRGQFHDFPLETLNRNNPDLLAANQWTKLDYTMLSKWFFLNEEKYNVSTLANVKEFSVPTGAARMSFTFAWQTIRQLGKRFKIELYLPLAILTVACINPKRGKIGMVVGYLAFATILVVYLALFKRFPGRIANPLLFSFAVSLLVLVGPLHERLVIRRNDRRTILAYGCFLTVFVLAFSGKFTYVKKIEAMASTHAERYLRAARHLELNYPNKVLLMQAGTIFSIVKANPLISYSYHDKLTIIPTGWPIYSPRFYRQLDRIGLQKASEILPYMVDNDDAYLLLKPDFTHLLVDYIRDTHNLTCILVAVDHLDASSTLYKLKSNH